jgi:hypothetical protein
MDSSCGAHGSAAHSTRRARVRGRQLPRLERRHHALVVLRALAQQVVRDARHCIERAAGDAVPRTASAGKSKRKCRNLVVWSLGVAAAGHLLRATAAVAGGGRRADEDAEPGCAGAGGGVRAAARLRAAAAASRGMPRQTTARHRAAAGEPAGCGGAARRVRASRCVHRSRARALQAAAGGWPPGARAARAWFWRGAACAHLTRLWLRRRAARERVVQARQRRRDAGARYARRRPHNCRAPRPPL